MLDSCPLHVHLQYIIGLNDIERYRFQYNVSMCRITDNFGISLVDV